MEVAPAHAQSARHELPAWFKPEAFIANDFSAESFVADLRRYVSALMSVEYSSDQPSLLHLLGWVTPSLLEHAVHMAPPRRSHWRLCQRSCRGTWLLSKASLLRYAV